MLVGLFQFNICWENKESSKVRILSLLKKNSKEFDWLIFPEMTLTGFSMNAEKTKLDESDLEFFKELAVHNNCFVTFGGNVQDKNTSMTIDSSGNFISFYEKNHLFSFAGENIAYKIGNHCENFSVNGFSISPAICYDLRFSYHFWNKAKTTDVYCIIANWPQTRKLHWRNLLIARAIENQTYVIAVNRTGEDPGNVYSGNSMVVDPLGTIVSEIESQEGIFIVGIENSKVLGVRKEFKFLSDRKE